jgi:hypothetical protein
VGDKSPSRVELAERYFVSGVLERKRAGIPLDKEEEELLAEARRRWGSSFSKGENNWALPAMPSSYKGNRVTFADLERLTAGEHIRHIYIAGSEATHAGANRIINNADFRRRDLFSTRPEIDIHYTGTIGQSAAYFLEVGIISIARFISYETKEWDTILKASDFQEQISASNELFREAYAQAKSRSNSNLF